MAEAWDWKEDASNFDPLAELGDAYEAWRRANVATVTEWTAFEAGVAEGIRRAVEEITNRIDEHHGPSVASVERAIVRAYGEEAERG